MYFCICGAVSDYLSCLSKYKVSDPAVIRAQPRQHKTFTTLLFQEYKYENKSVGKVHKNLQIHILGVSAVLVK